MCRKLFLLISFLLVLGLVGSTSAALPQGWQSQDIGTTGGSAAENCGTWIISADGADVWGSSDEFHYAYATLSGDGEIVARVVDNGTGSNGWAKGGVMIRETLEADSKHALMALTGGEGGGMAFQNRQETGGSSFSSHGNPTAEPPYWVKLTRVGSTITGYSSIDGITWEQQPDGTGGDMTTNPVEIEMGEEVYIGLFVTSHASGEVRTYIFDNVGGIEQPRVMDNWQTAVVQADPAFLATNVEDGLYDIGTFSGDITYEFCVLSNPDEEEASMALIGRRQFGETQVGIKYEQWNNTGTYGATVFGVVDLDYGVPTAPGFDTHLTFVSSEGTATTALYVNGVYQASVDSAITLSGLVGIGYGAQGEDMSGSFDNFDGDIYGVAIYDWALSDEQIAAHSDAFFEPISDVTAPGDIVQGIPDDGDWPPNEAPPLAIDDNVQTKYLHFKGDFEPDPDTGGSGFRVTPSACPSVVTGLTFTTANDVPGRDPILFEFYGSNESIDGPYELIATGDIVDFAQEFEWPRFTQNETPIMFDNDIAYDHYQIIFPAIRGPVGGSVNSMQIADVQLLGLRLRCENIGIPSTCPPVEPNAIYSKTDSAGNLLELWCTGAYHLCFTPAGATKSCQIGLCRFSRGENVGWVCYDPWGKFTSVTWLNYEGHVDPKNPNSAVDDNENKGQEDRDRYFYDVASGILTKTPQERTLKPSGKSDPGGSWVSKTPVTCNCLTDCDTCPTTSAITSLGNIPRITPVGFGGSIQGGGQVIVGIHGTQVVVPTTAGMDVQQLALQVVDIFNLCWQRPQVPGQTQSPGQQRRQQQTKSASIDTGFGQVVLFHNVDEEEMRIQLVGEPELMYDFSAYPE